MLAPSESAGTSANGGASSENIGSGGGIGSAREGGREEEDEEEPEVDAEDEASSRRAISHSTRRISAPISAWAAASRGGAGTCSSRCETPTSAALADASVSSRADSVALALGHVSLEGRVRPAYPYLAALLPHSAANGRHHRQIWDPLRALAKRL